MEIVDQKKWDEFVSANGGQFLQSWDWSELQKSLGKKIWRLGVEENNQLQATSLIIKNNLPFGKSYLYSPRGPLFIDSPSPAKGRDGVGLFNQLLNEIKLIAKTEKSIFYRLEPLIQIPNTKYQITNPTQPHQTLILDLTPSEDQLLSSFHQKTRYNINLAQKKGITIYQGTTENDFEIFWRLLQQTYTKQNIKTHSKEYYKKILNFQFPISNFKVKLYIAKYEDKPIAANLMYYFTNTATYAHGGSDYNYRNLMAPHLLQWRQISDAKNAGYKYYDFWGFDENKWPGVSRFKAGFSGQIKKYSGTFDLVFDKTWYQLYRLSKLIF